MIGCIRAMAPYGPAVGTEDAEGLVARSAGERGNHLHPHRPAPVREQLYKILFKPDKNASEYKAVVEAARRSQRAPLDLLTAAWI